MDKETRAALADILSTSLPKKVRTEESVIGRFPPVPPRVPPPAPPIPPIPPSPDTFEASKYYGIRYGRAKAKPKFTLGIDEIPTVDNTLDKTAILSVNTAKACIVLKAEYTMATLQEIQRIAGDGNKRMQWNSGDKVLELDPTYLAPLKLLLKQNYASVQVLGIQKQAKATKFDVLLSKLDASDKKSIYSMLARKYHPDMPTGNKEIMTLVNLVFKGGD